MARTRDNRHVILPRAFVEQEKFASAVTEVERALQPQVLRVRYDFGDDWSGEPAVFFRIVLADAATTRDQLLKVTTHVSSTLEQRIEPLEQWGVLPYFNFRGQSEQALMQDEAWA
jgi:hypothetical protein